MGDAQGRSDIPLDQFRFDGRATVLHKPGAVRLDAYPLLCYAPGQWGPGIRVASNGAEVADICAALAESAGNAAAVADRFGVTADEVYQAARYALESGAATTGGG